MTCPQRTSAPTARNSNAGIPIALTQTNACGTKNTRDTVSNPSATSSRWLSRFMAELGGYADKEDWESK
jgi:hypothetical protein